MPFQPGNQLGRFPKPKPFLDALKMEVAAAAQGQPCPAPRGSLRYIARAMLNRASDGDTSATTFITERLDGKVPQAIVGDSEHDPIAIRAVAWLETEPPNQPALEHDGNGAIEQHESGNGAAVASGAAAARISETYLTGGRLETESPLPVAARINDERQEVPSPRSEPTAPLPSVAKAGMGGSSAAGE